MVMKYQGKSVQTETINVEIDKDIIQQIYEYFEWQSWTKCLIIDVIDFKIIDTETVIVIYNYE
ncbi:hypothetical protein [uncultured Arcobacter sp.]|uniref:hypothetical protein n=1 Tax=uncultured Arcobacter sp. TaxID=165434 RepID=UPI002605F937|nr:hypothetical protein [uncultured Arcobacter sp.]